MPGKLSFVWVEVLKIESTPVHLKLKYVHLKLKSESRVATSVHFKVKSADIMHFSSIAL